MSCRDRISSLPDEVLGKILSFLSTHHDAVSTSVLSKRWRTLHLLVDGLYLDNAKGDDRYFCDFVDKTLALFSDSTILKSFSLSCTSTHQCKDSQVEDWIHTVLQRGISTLKLHIEDQHCLEPALITSDTLVELSLCDFYLEGDLPPEDVFLPKLKKLSLVQVSFSSSRMYERFISGCPLLEEFCLHDDDDEENPPTWNGVVLSPSIKRLTIYQDRPHHRDAHKGCCWVETPSLVYLDYSSYVAEEYKVDPGSLVEARLHIQSWEHNSDEDESYKDDDDDADDIFGDVTGLVTGITNVKTLHLSADSLEVFHLCCQVMPVFLNLLTLSFESEKERGWQVVPLLLNNSPNLETLVIKGLVHEVTDKCGDACACIHKRAKKNKRERKKKEEGVCCLSTCQVKVLNISGYHGARGELKQMRHFLRNLKCLETVKVGLKLNQDKDVNKYMTITNALTKLPRVSSNCQIQFF